jgi:hypothetical protein
MGHERLLVSLGSIAADTLGSPKNAQPASDLVAKETAPARRGKLRPSGLVPGAARHKADVGSQAADSH